MRKNFGEKSWFYPLPVLIIGTYNEDGTADAMNAAWGGQYGAEKAGKVRVSCDKKRICKCTSYR